MARSDWLWLCRASYERDLIEELAAASKKITAARVSDGIVRSSQRPRAGQDPLELAFARQGLPVDAELTAVDPGELATAAAGAIAPALGKHPFALHVIFPDSDEGNRLAARADDVERELLARLTARDPSLPGRRIEAHEAKEGSDRLAQLCLLDGKRAVCGTLPIGAAVSMAPGGRRRIGAPAGAPSRAAAKLLEAFDWLGRAPDPGDRCIDLGAAPGGWTHVLLERRARVIAVDPAKMAPELARNKHLVHLQRSAFEYLPDEPADWVFCDMAWRPLEVAALLAKWGRRGAARFLVANIKLPMKKKVEHIARVKEILATGGWQSVRVRQLYHDREEITLGAWRM